jgi:hypothetical protein
VRLFIVTVSLLLGSWSAVRAAEDPVRIATPASGSTVARAIDITLAVDVPYTSADIYFDGTIVGVVSPRTTPPHTLRLDTTLRANGAHGIHATALLSDDNGTRVVGQADATITVANAPPVRIASPAAWSAVSGTVDVTLQVDTLYTSADILVDGALVGAVSRETTPPHTLRLDTAALPNGAHTLRAQAFLSDASGKRLLGQHDVTVNVSNAGSPDAVQILAPADWAHVSGTIDVTVEVNGLHTRTNIYVDGALAGFVAAHANPRVFRLDTRPLRFGAHTITAKAVLTDASGTRVIGQDAATVNVDNSAQPMATLDVYGGRTDVVCTGGARAQFYREKIGRRWWLCTPHGHGFISIAAYAVSWTGLDPERLQQKYATGGPTANQDPRANWAYRMAQRYGGWGFNSYADYSETGAAGHILAWRVDPEAWPDGDHTIPLKMPFVTIHKSSSAAQRNSGGYAAAPAKGWRVGLKHVLDLGYYYLPYLDGVDYFDPNWSVYAERSFGQEPYYAIQREVNRDWVLGVSFDDMDHIKFAGPGDAFPTLVRGQPQAGQAQHVPHWGLLTLIASPVHTVDTAALNSQLAGYQPLYQDEVFHAKREFVAWLQKTAQGGPGYPTIEALNASWGLGTCGNGGYCSFTSQATTHAEELCPSQWDGVSYRCTQTLAHPPTPLTLRVARGGSLIGGDDASGYHPAPGAPMSPQGLLWGTGLHGGADSVDYATGTVTITFADVYDGANGYVYPSKIEGAQVPDATLPHHRIAPGMVTVQVEGLFYCQDDGEGNLVRYTGTGHTRADRGCSGRIDYATGAISGLTISPAPAGQWVNVNYAVPAPPAAGSAPTVAYKSGGWGSGAGVADEDGTCPARGASNCWMPAASWSLAGANANLRRDLDNFLQHYAAAAFAGERAAVQKHLPGALLFCNSGGYDTPAHAPVLRAMGEHCDVALDASAFSQAGVDDADMIDRYNHFIAHVGDMPIGSWEGFGANPDSHLFETADHMKTSPPVAATQADRAATYAAILDAALNTRDSTYDSYHFVAWKWWALVDTRGEGYNWGLVDTLDNAYDGHETRTGTVACSPPVQAYTCGGDNGDWGNFLGPVTVANKRWLSLPPD